MRYRVERDVVGYKKIPSESYYGIHTERSKETFNVAGRRIALDLFLDIALIKIACTNANMELGFLDKQRGGAIVKACNEVIKGKFDEFFVADIFQAGAGVNTHMNVNEVIANRAIEILKRNKGDYDIVHPNAHVNMGQNTNNVFPSAIKISSYFKLKELVNNLEELRKELINKSKEFRSVISSSKEGVQDAVPKTLGNEFKVYSSMIERDIARIKEIMSFLSKLTFGRSVNHKFNKKILINLNKLTNVKWGEGREPIESTQSVTDFLEVSEVLKILALDLTKVCNDFRLLSSGVGLKEIRLPSVEPENTSGKITSSIAEMLNMICFQVLGNNEAINHSVQSGQLELNSMLPLIAHNLLESLDILNNGVDTFVQKCVKSINVDEEVCRYYFEHSAGLATLLNPYFGYDKVAWIVKESLKTGESIREIVLRKKLMNKAGIDKILDYRRVTGPNLKR